MVDVTLGGCRKLNQYPNRNDFSLGKERRKGNETMAAKVSIGRGKERKGKERVRKIKTIAMCSEIVKSR